MKYPTEPAVSAGHIERQRRGRDGNVAVRELICVARRLVSVRRFADADPEKKTEASERDQAPREDR